MFPQDAGSSFVEDENFLGNYSIYWKFPVNFITQKFCLNTNFAKVQKYVL